MDMVQIDTLEAWQNIECHDCGNEWQDRYALVGVIADTQPEGV